MILSNYVINGREFRLLCTSCGVLKEASARNVDAQDETINVGYGTAKASDLAYSVQKVKMEGVKDIASYSNIYEYLKGRCPGVEIDFGTNGATPSVRIRGINSFNASCEPLFIVDGITVVDLSGINPRDVYSVEVMKDSSAAIYGISGANGVISITTKCGHNQTE